MLPENKFPAWLQYSIQLLGHSIRVRNRKHNLDAYDGVDRTGVDAMFLQVVTLFHAAVDELIDALESQLPDLLLDIGRKVGIVLHAE